MFRLIVCLILFIELRSFLLKAEDLYTTLLDTRTTLTNITLYKNNALDNKNLFTIYNKNYVFPNIYKKEIIDLELFDIYKEYRKDNIVVKPIEFINENTKLNFIVNVKKVCFQELIFNMENKAEVNLTFLLNSDMEVTGKPISIIGNEENSKAVINMSNSNNKTHKHKLALYAIHSAIPTELKIENIQLFINNEIQFSEDKTQVFITNSLINGNIKLRGIENTVIVHNTTFKDCTFNFYNEKNQFTLENVKIDNSKYQFKTKDNTLKFTNVEFVNDSKVILESIGNNIEIINSFKGNIESLKEDTTLLFKNAQAKYTVINLNSNNILKFGNSFITNSKLTFNGNGNNIINFLNTSIDAHLNFKNNGINSFQFDTSGFNRIDGHINIYNNSIVNFKFKSNSKTELSMLINGYVNEFNIESFSEIMLKNKETININKLIYNDNITIGIDLSNTKNFYLYIKEYQFNKDAKINLQAYSISKLLSSESDEIVYKLLKSEADLDKSLDIKLVDNLFDYNIVIKNNEILLTLKKNQHKTICGLVKKYYKNNQSIFYEKDFLSLARYIDLLHKVGNCSKIDSILDYINNINLINNSTQFITFLSNLLPISNNILYRASYDTTLSFLDELNSINNKERAHENNIWSSIYHLENNFTLAKSKTTNINLIGNALATGVIYPINNYFDIGAAISCSYNNITNYTYNINMFSVNFATHSKVFITNNLCNLSAISLNLQNFDTGRNVIMYGYDSINYGSPLGKSFIFHNLFSYSLNILKCKIITFNVKPNIKFTLGKVQLSDYNETGKESLFIQGFNTFTTTTELGIDSLIGVRLDKAHIDTNISVGIGYESNNLSSTNFKFTDDKSNFNAELADYSNKHSYLKYNIGLVYTPLNNLYDIKLLCSYKKCKINNNTKIGASLSLKF